MWVKRNEFNGIELDCLKVTDIKCGDIYAGCQCSKTNDRNRYDKESGTIICKNYSSCLSSVLRHMPKHQKVDIIEMLETQINWM